MAVPPAPTGVVTNRINGPYQGGVFQGFGNYVAALSIATDGVISTATDGSDNFQNQWDTYFDGVGLTDFAGLYYGTPVTFDSVTADTFTLGFGDGGDWETTPKVYILRVPYYTEAIRPELHPYWEEVPATTSAMFSGTPTPGLNTVTFDLSALSTSQRSGYGWAIGGVDGNQNGGGVANFITVTELAATGNATLASNVPMFTVPATLKPVNVLANQYNGADLGNEGYGYNRGVAFEAATNGIIYTAPADEFKDQFDTFPVDGEANTLTEFAGLYYGALAVFDTVSAHTLTSMYVDGGEWAVQPKLYRLVNNVDTDRTRPEDDPTDWVEVTGAAFSSAITPDPTAIEQANTFSFDLTALPLGQRLGYGWAIGGVDGTQSAGDPDYWHFITVTELQATGTYVPEPASAVLFTILAGMGLLTQRRVRIS